MTGSKVPHDVKASIVIDKINNPTMTTRDLQKKYEKDGIKSNSTIGIYVKSEITQKTQTFDKMIKENNEIIAKANELILDKFINQKESLRASEISTIKDHSFKQNQLLTGGATENVNLNMKELELMSTEELQEKLAELKGN